MGRFPIRSMRQYRVMQRMKRDILEEGGDPYMYLNKKNIALIVVLGVLLGSLITLTIISTSGLTIKSTLENWMGATEASVVNQPNSAAMTSSDLPASFSKIVEAYNIIQNSYYDKETVEPQSLIDGAIKGMIGVLDDPYSSYMDKEEITHFEESLGSSFEGIGTEVMLKNNRVTIVSPFKDSPAEKSGLKPNDQIITVDGENIEGMDINSAVKKIRGPKGTKVKLEVLRPGISDAFTIVVTRDTIPLESVYSEMFEVGGKKLGKIEIASFSENTATRFTEEYESLKRNGAKGIVIDVRGNPGGYLQAVLGIAGRLVSEDHLIMQVEDRDGNREKYNGQAKGKILPLIVLTDQGSASASEILAAALKDSGVPVLGQTTFGKGTVQVPKMMKDGASIKITIAKWLTPDGTWIHQKGVTPTKEVLQPDYFYAAPIHAEETSLKAEMNSIEVKNLQMILKGLGYSDVRADGYFDNTTADAVRTFQMDHKIKVTGEVDMETAQKLQDQLIEQIRNPENDLQLQTALKDLAKSIK